MNVRQMFRNCIKRTSNGRCQKIIIVIILLIMGVTVYDKASLQTGKPGSIEAGTRDIRTRIEGNTIKVTDEDRGSGQASFYAREYYSDNGTALTEDRRLAKTFKSTETEIKSMESDIINATDYGTNLTSLGTFKVTAYCACKKCCGKEPSDPGYGITASGSKVKAGSTIAVDSTVITLDSYVQIGNHVYHAEDTGSAVKGNVIDIYFDTHEEAIAWGVKEYEIFLIEGNDIQCIDLTY